MHQLLPPLPLDFRLLFEGERFLALRLLRPPLRSEGDRFIAVVAGAVWYATGYLHSLYTAPRSTRFSRIPTGHFLGPSVT